MTQELQSVEIRYFEDACIESCISIYIDAFSQPPWNESWTPESARKRMQGIIERKGFTGFLAQVESNPVGFVLGHHLTNYPLKDYFHIQELLVASQFRRLGIGKQLMTALMASLTEINIHKMSLLTRKGSPAERIFTKMGFKKVLWGFSVKKKVWMIYSFSIANSKWINWSTSKKVFATMIERLENISPTFIKISGLPIFWTTSGETGPPLPPNPPRNHQIPSFSPFLLFSHTFFCVKIQLVIGTPLF